MISSSILKNIKLKKISATLGKPFDFNNKNLVQNKMKGSDEKDKALNELYLLSKDFKLTSQRLEGYKISEKKFKEIYKKLLEEGAGQWVKGHYVAASSLVFGSSLEYIHNELEEEEPDWPRIAFNLVLYFETGKVT